MPRVAALKQRARADGIADHARQQPRLLRPRGDAPASPRRRRRRSLAGLPGRALRHRHRVGRRVKGCPSLQSRELRRRQPARAAAPRDLGRRARARVHARAAPSTISGASAGPAPSPTRAWAAAASPRTRFFGRPGNNPYCHFRARMLAERGLRERLVPASPAPGAPFDHGTFDLVVEPLDAPEPPPPPARLSASITSSTAANARSPRELRMFGDHIRISREPAHRCHSLTVHVEPPRNHLPRFPPHASPRRRGHASGAGAAPAAEAAAAARERRTAIPSQQGAQMQIDHAGHRVLRRAQRPARASTSRSAMPLSTRSGSRAASTPNGTPR